MFHDYAPVFIIGMLNSFAEKTENGIIDFDTYVTDPEKYDGFLIYDKSNGKVVCDMCVDELHSDIVGYFDFFDGVDIRVIEDDGICRCRFRQEQHRGREWPLVRFQFRLDPWPETIF